MNSHHLSGSKLHTRLVTSPRGGAWEELSLRGPIPEAPASDAVTVADFTLMLGQELRFRGVAVDRRAVADFAASVWSMAQEDLDPARWARDFLNGLIDRGNVGEESG